MSQRGLDPAGIRELRGHLQQLAHDHNVTIFLSSHVEQVADCIGIINRGQLLFQGKLQELQRYQAPLTVVADRGFDAAALLKANGWRVLKESEDLLEVEISLDADIAAI
jgi:lantibiotic transport system ATP-binding protein